MPPITPADTPSLICFLAVVAVVLASAIGGTAWLARRGKGLTAGQARSTITGILVWLGLSSLYTWSGFVEAHPMPGLPIFFASVVASAVVFALSPAGKAFAKHAPITTLVAFQGFRLPLEGVLHSWAAQGTVPETMTWSGQNWDIVSGFVALGLAPLASRSRAAAWIANGVGVALLLNVLRVALLSAPLPFGWHLDKPLLVALYLPYAWIGSVCVAGAIAGHVVLTRTLLHGAR